MYHIYLCTKLIDHTVSLYLLGTMYNIPPLNGYFTIFHRILAVVFYNLFLFPLYGSPSDDLQDEQPSLGNIL